MDEHLTIISKITEEIIELGTEDITKEILEADRYSNVTLKGLTTRAVIDTMTTEGTLIIKGIRKNKIKKVTITDMETKVGIEINSIQ